MQAGVGVIFSFSHGNIIAKNKKISKWQRGSNSQIPNNLMSFEIWGWCFTIYFSIDFSQRDCLMRKAARR